MRLVVGQALLYARQRRQKCLRRHAARIFVALLLVCGACLCGRAVYLHAKAALARVLISNAWEEMLRTGQPARPWAWADTHPVARLRIPRIGYDEFVLEGATLRTLAFGPARLRSGPAFGEPGNLTLAGHRNNWFAPLEKVTDGDTIELEWYDAALRATRRRIFIVQSVQVVAPEDERLLAEGVDDALTLITCYPFDRGPNSPLRYIVRAAPLGPSVAMR